MESNSDYKTVSRGIDNSNETITVWDSVSLQGSESSVFIDFSPTEWSAILQKLVARKFESSGHYAGDQGDVLFQNTLVSKLNNLFPEVIEKLRPVPLLLETGYRFCVVRGLMFDELEKEARDFLILGISCLVGHPTATDKVNKVIMWPVKPESAFSVTNTTFSQRTGEAAYHTDTQYFENPERHMSLWCLNPDKDGGGVSGLIDGRKVMQEIEKRYGETVLKILAEPVYPFRVPSVFTNNGSDEVIEVYFGAILNLNDPNKPLIRYRKETLDKGISASGAALNSDHKYALSCIEDVLHDKSLEFSYLLKKGDVLFANNHELLHMRSHFDDLERSLIRVRFNSLR